jgi:DNA-binding transcriptional ArsR family regulator
MTRQAVSKHLSVLEAAGLIEHERWGRERRHRLKSEPLREMDDWLAPYAAVWDRRLDRLSRYLMEDLNDPDD